MACSQGLTVHWSQCTLQAPQPPNSTKNCWALRTMPTCWLHEGTTHLGELLDSISPLPSHHFEVLKEATWSMSYPFSEATLSISTSEAHNGSLSLLHQLMEPGPIWGWLWPGWVPMPAQGDVKGTQLPQDPVSLSNHSAGPNACTGWFAGHAAASGHCIFHGPKAQHKAGERVGLLLSQSCQGVWHALHLTAAAESSLSNYLPGAMSMGEEMGTMHARMCEDSAAASFRRLNVHTFIIPEGSLPKVMSTWLEMVYFSRRTIIFILEKITWTSICLCFLMREQQFSQ